MKWIQRLAGMSEYLHQLLSQRFTTNAFLLQDSNEVFLSGTLLTEKKKVLKCETQGIQLLGLCSSKAWLSNGSGECCSPHKRVLLFHLHSNLSLRRPNGEVWQGFYQGWM